MSGILGIASSQPVALDIFKSLHWLQDRGTRYAAIFMKNGEREHIEISRNGFVRSLFGSPFALQSLRGNAGIAFVGNGISQDEIHKPNSQPITLSLAGGIPCSACFSGIMTNYEDLRKKLEADGAILKTHSYAELVIHLANRTPGSSFSEKALNSLEAIEGSFSLIIMVKDELIAARDPLGSRPLSAAEIENGFIFASESCAFTPSKISSFGEIEPGEAIIMSSGKMSRQRFSAPKEHKFCILELINFASPASKMYGRSVFEFRRALGQKTGEAESFDASCIIPSPKAGQAFVIGMAEATGLPVINAIIENGHSHRHLFPSADSYLEVRFGLLRELLEMESLILADDIMQSAKTAQFLTQLLRSSQKVGQIAFRPSCPPIDKSRCQFRRSSQIIGELDYKLFSEGGITEYLGVEDFRYLSIDTIKQILGQDANQFCFQCLNTTK